MSGNALQEDQNDPKRMNDKNRFLHEGSLVQQHADSFRFCLPSQRYKKDYRDQIARFFKEEPCQYTPRIFCISSYVFGCLKGSEKSKYFEEIRLKSAVGLKLKRLLDGKQSSAVAKTTRGRDLWRKVKISDITLMSRENGLTTETIHGKTTDDRKLVSEESSDVALSLLTYILDRAFDVIDKPGETLPTPLVEHIDSDVDTNADSVKDSASRKSQIVEKKKIKSVSAKQLRNVSSKRVHSKRQTKSAMPASEIKMAEFESGKSELTEEEAFEALGEVGHKSILKNSMHSCNYVTEDLESRVPRFESEVERRLAFRLAYETLKYQEYLQEILENSKFFYKHYELIEDFDLVMVILCDYKLRKFHERRPIATEIEKDEKNGKNKNEKEVTDGNEGEISETNPSSKEENPSHVESPDGDQTLQDELKSKLNIFASIESALRCCKSRLNASLARCRIRLGVSSLLSLLPENVRRADEIAPEMFVCCWINQLNISVSEMTSKLMKSGFVGVDQEEELVGMKTFKFDHHCHDVIYFSKSCFEFIEKSDWRRDRLLVLQDKSNSLAVHSLLNLASQGLGDVLHVNPGCGLTTCHLYSLFQVNSLTSEIFAVGIGSVDQKRKLLKNFERFGLKGKVHIIDDLQSKDNRLTDVRLALVTSNCSKSSLVNPVQFLLDEGEDLSALRDLAEGCSDENRIGHLSNIQALILKRVIMLPSIQGVVYYTRSFFESENEGVVTPSLEFFSTQKADKPPFRVVPPVIAMREEDLTSGEVQFNGQFISFLPTKFNNGCFLAVLTKEADDPRETMVQILARAEAKGIIKSENEQAEVTSQSAAATERGGTAWKRQNVPPPSGAKRKHSIVEKMKKSRIARVGTGSFEQGPRDAKSTQKSGDEGSSNEDAG